MQGTVQKVSEGDSNRCGGQGSDISTDLARAQGQTEAGSNPGCASVCCATLGQLFALSEPQILICKMGIILCTS